MKAIETSYKGYKFRSRLEARWAVFFEQIGADWEYEPEGFDCDGVWYLPDFVIHNGVCKYGKGRDLYIEVKGCLTDEDRYKIKSFCKNLMRELDSEYEFGAPVFVFGRIPQGEEFFDFFRFVSEHYDWECDMFFNFSFMCDCYKAIPAKGKDGRFYMSGEDYFEYIDEQATVSAYKKALSARFEHGVFGGCDD